MVDREIIETRVEKIRKYVNTMNILSNIQKEEFLTNPIYFTSAEKCIETSIQAILDISAHIITEQSIGKPESYSDILKLKDENIITKEFYEKIKDLPNFRNILIHEYLEVNIEKIYDFIYNRLGIFEEFIRE